jgi:hypothetical protein
MVEPGLAASVAPAEGLDTSGRLPDTTDLRLGARPDDGETTTGALLQRAQAGDRAALRELVHELNPLLWHVAPAEGLNAEDAADNNPAPENRLLT